MKIFRSKSFKKDYKKLPPHIQKKTRQCLWFLINDYHHPSLRVHKVKGWKDILEARVSKNYRLTFHLKEDIYMLRRIGTHNILNTP